MEVRLRPSQSGPVLAAVFALLVIGVGSLYLTWQSIRHQREVVENHMVLSGEVIARGVEANLMRMMRSMRGNPAMGQIFASLSEDLFQEITESSEVAFVALYGPDGDLITGSRHEGQQLDEQLPRPAFEALTASGRWHGMTDFQSQDVLVVGLRAHPGVARLCGGMRTGMNTGKGHGQGRGMGAGRGEGQNGPVAFLVVGLSAQKHLAQFHLFRRAALLQTGYVFGVAVLLWLLAFAYLKRRGQAHRVGQLERFQSKLLDNMPDGLVTLSPQGEIVAANPSARRLLDPACTEDGCALTGRGWSEFPFDDHTDSARWRQHDYHGRKLEILCLPFQEAPEITGESGAVPGGESCDNDSSRLILIRDRTALRRLETDLEEARRLATIGSLAAGVAHEVRNPLSALRGFAQFFADKLGDTKPYGEYAATMVKEADRLGRVVTDLLYLARPRDIAPGNTDLPATMESLGTLMRFDMEHKEVDLETELTARTVHADPDGLTQVLLNLITNALHAVDGSKARVRVFSRRDGQGVTIGVEDNGPGIPQEDREQALEPFFTTKRKGTGLGLAIVEAILHAHHGRVRIGESELGGALVELYFPDADTPHDAANTDSHKEA